MNRIALIIGFFILFLDQITKALVLSYVSGKTVAVLPFFNLVLVWNRGISFGLFGDAPHFGPVLLIVLSLAIIAFLIFWLTRTPQRGLYIAICAVIAGALGNVIDRIRFGAVVDFIDLHAFGWHYPAFNIADSAIVLGIAFILFDSIFLEPKRRNLQGTDPKAP